MCPLIEPASSDRTSVLCMDVCPLIGHASSSRYYRLSIMDFRACASGQTVSNHPLQPSLSSDWGCGVTLRSRHNLWSPTWRLMCVYWWHPAAQKCTWRPAAHLYVCVLPPIYTYGALWLISVYITPFGLSLCTWRPVAHLFVHGAMWPISGYILCCY